MLIYHIATAKEWADARSRGSYEISTRGRSLAEEGFIHAARRDQVQGVFDRYYRDLHEPLVLLTISTDRLTAEWREEQVGEETYPHIFGPLNSRAVVNAEPLSPRGQPESLLRVVVRESGWRMAGALLAMALGFLGATLATQWEANKGPDTWWPFIGGCVGVIAGAIIALAVGRWRVRR